MSWISQREIQLIPIVKRRSPTAEEAAHLEWRACDADGAFTALLTISSARGDVTVNMVVSTAAGTPWPPNGWRVYGDEGTLLAEGATFFTVCRLGGAGADREVLPVPQRLLDELPSVGDDVTNKDPSPARRKSDRSCGAP
jgi:predicted dehydrogenase